MAIDLHKLKPAIGRMFPFGEAPEAFRCTEKRGHVGKVCIRF